MLSTVLTSSKNVLFSPRVKSQISKNICISEGKLVLVTLAASIFSNSGTWRRKIFHCSGALSEKSSQLKLQLTLQYLLHYIICFYTFYTLYTSIHWLFLGSILAFILKQVSGFYRRPQLWHRKSFPKSRSQKGKCFIKWLTHRVSPKLWIFGTLCIKWYGNIFHLPWRESNYNFYLLGQNVKMLPYASPNVKE